MRHKLHKLARPVIEVKIPRPNGEAICFTVAAIPIGLNREFTQIVPKPSPPTETITRVGKSPEAVRHWEDPSFIKSMEEFAYLQSMYFVYRILDCDTNIEWDVRPIDINSMRALAKGIADTGLSDGDIAMLIEKAKVISNIMPEDLEAARKSFL